MVMLPLSTDKFIVTSSGNYIDTGAIDLSGWSSVVFQLQGCSSASIGLSAQPTSYFNDRAYEIQLVYGNYHTLL